MLKVLLEVRRDHRALLPIDEFFLVTIRLRLGLLEKDLAYRFGISQPTVSRILITWINLITVLAVSKYTTVAN